jgi:hypothetical protein
VVFSEFCGMEGVRNGHPLTQSLISLNVRLPAANAALTTNSGKSFAYRWPLALTWVWHLTQLFVQRCDESPRHDTPPHQMCKDNVPSTFCDGNICSEPASVSTSLKKPWSLNHNLIWIISAYLKMKVCNLLAEPLQDDCIWRSL